MSLISFNSPKISLTPPEHLEFFVDKANATSSSVLTISSKSSHLTVCRLKSSSPNDFEFNNENIIIPPKSNIEISITYRYSKDSYMRLNKFLLQTLVVRQNESIDWKGPGVHEYKLFARLLDAQYSPKPDLDVQKPEPVIVREEIKTVVQIKPKGPGKLQKLGKLVCKCKDVICTHRFSFLHLVFSFVLGSLLSYYIILNLA